ncbi:MAG: DUF4345 family protein [Pseudomonadota bacterium]
MHPAFHPTLLQRIVVGLTGLIALAISYGGLINPDSFLAGMELSATGPAGINETRGQYGGFFFLVAIYTGLGVLGYVRPTSVLGFLLVLYGGVLFGRIWHLAAIGFDSFATYPFTMQAIHFVDFCGLVLSAIALRQGSNTRA